LGNSPDAELNDSGQNTPDDKTRLELLYKLIERSDRLRASYGSRAAMVLSSDALVLTTISVLIGKIKTDLLFSPVLLFLLLLSGVLVCASVALALLASTGFPNESSNDEANFPREHRFLFNPADTFSKAGVDVKGREFRDTQKVFESFEKFNDAYQQLTFKDLMKSASAELWVSYTLQRKRNN
jgi:hypothetical protein